MSLKNLLGDIFSGNFTHAGERIKDWWTSLSPGLQNFVTTVETDEGQILQGLVVTAAQDVLTGGLTTASFVNAAKDVGQKLVSQNVTMANTTIFAALNAEVANAAATAGVAVPLNNGTTAVPVVTPAYPS